MEEIFPEDFWYAENEMAVENDPKNLLTEPFPEFQQSLLVAVINFPNNVWIGRRLLTREF